MVLIVITVRDQQLRMNTNNKDPVSNGITDNRTLQDNILKNTKIVMKQALAYTLINMFGFVMIIVIPFVRVVRNLSHIDPPVAFQFFYLILRPIQGLLNSIVFIYHKASNLQRAHPTLDFITAVRKVLKGEEEQGDGRVVSGLVLLRQFSALGRLNCAFEFDDESSSDDDSPEIEEPPVDRNDSFG